MDRASVSTRKSQSVVKEVSLAMVVARPVVVAAKS